MSLRGILALVVLALSFCKASCAETEVCATFPDIVVHISSLWLGVQGIYGGCLFSAPTKIPLSQA